jgi:O-methyltransferase
MANTFVDVYRLYELWQVLEQVAHLDGDILEVGVWRGGQAARWRHAVSTTAASSSATASRGSWSLSGVAIR